jgi:hypothetical protein
MDLAEMRNHQLIREDRQRHGDGRPDREGEQRVHRRERISGENRSARRKRENRNRDNQGDQREVRDLVPPRRLINRVGLAAVHCFVSPNLMAFQPIGRGAARCYSISGSSGERSGIPSAASSLRLRSSPPA